MGLCRDSGKKLVSLRWFLVLAVCGTVTQFGMSAGSGTGCTMRRPSIAELGKMKLADVRESLKSALSELQVYEQRDVEFEDATGDGVDPSGAGIAGKLREILAEGRAMRAEREQIIKLRQNYEALQSTLVQQQRYLE